jgi:hypothetical protein
MKILNLIILSLTISCVLGKEMKISSKNKQISVVDRFPDTVLHASVPNDAYTLQHQAVRIYHKINYLAMDFILGV